MSKEMEEGLAEKEVEYQQLTEQLRTFQNDRQQYIDQMQKQVKNLKAEIAMLEAEREDLITKLNNVNSPANQKKNERDTEDLANLAENKEWLEQQIEEEKAKQAELDSKIRVLCACRLKQKGENVTEVNHEEVADHNAKTKRKITTLHDRLQNGLKQYNDLLSSNARLREEIDTLRCERHRYDEIYKRLDSQLTKIRRETAQLIQEACYAYSEREEANMKMLMIKEKMERDTLAHNHEMKELVRAIDNERKLKEFMDTKGREREEDPQFTAYKAKKAKEAEERRAAEETSQEAYVLAFSHIFELIGTTKVKSVLPTFIEREDRNFALYNFVNELNAQYDTLKHEVAELRDRLSRMSTNNVIECKELRCEYDKLEFKKHELEKSIAKSQSTLDANNNDLKIIMQKLGELFVLMKCDRSGLDSRLGSGDSVQIYDVFDYLFIIEERLNFLILINNFIIENDSKADLVAASPIIGGNIKKDVDIIGFRPPNIIEDFAEDSVDMPMPLSRIKLVTRAMRIVCRKENEVATRPLVGIPIH